ncbi:MFS transporter [Oceanobacillus sp. CFH 90083]|uniref:MFS transporter n=1 Tax=Oceanobacillus sp. CFH 90083 TaxID=2592336 RepID=UPI001D148EBE|nr:MFS transporter [Oceanobacillus sp. CFH 90083]
MRLSKQAFARRYYIFLLLLAILLIAATLRSPITSVGPLIPLFRGELEASNAMIGLVSTLPLLAFGLFSPFVPRISGKLGMEMTLLISMSFLSIGVFIRASGGLELLLFGTLLTGMAIAVGNILMPGLIKSTFPYRMGLITGLYSVSMNIFGALASGVSVPITSINGFDWRHAMQLWSVLSLAAVIVLLLRCQRCGHLKKKCLLM